MAKLTEYEIALLLKNYLDSLTTQPQVLGTLNQKGLAPLMNKSDLVEAVVPRKITAAKSIVDPTSITLGDLKSPRLVADESLLKNAAQNAAQNPIDDAWLNTNAELLGDLDTSKAHLRKAKAGRRSKAIENFVNNHIAASGGNFNAAVSAKALKQSSPYWTGALLATYFLGQEAYNDFANGGNRLTAGQLNTRPATTDYVNNLKTSDLANLDLGTIVDYAYNFGLMNDDDKESLARIKNRLDLYNYTRSHSAYEGDGNVLKYTWGSVKELLNEFFTGTEADKKDAEVLKKLNQAVDEINSMNLNITPELLTSEGGAYYVPTPDSYTSAMINPNDYKVAVNPVKRYTNQELADLYNINYSVDDYYNLLKQGTEAAIDYGKFVNEQNLNTVLASDTQEQNAYLDSIRNTKAESIINGATLGARMANELLDNVAANQAYSTKVANANAQAIQNMQQYYDNNARAMVDARAYHDTTLAPKLSNVLENLYYDDIQRYSGEVNTNADLYMNVANANANAIINNAAVQAAYNNLVAQRDKELNYLFEFIEANKNPLNRSGQTYNNKEAIVEGIRDYTNYLSGEYSGGNMTSYYDYLMNKK